MYTKLTLFTTMLIWLVASVANAAEQDIILKGAKLYNDNCARCHNARPAEQFTKREWSVVMPHMRVRAHLTGVETLAVEAFISRTLTAELPAISGTKQTGAELFQTYACGGCHKTGGNGGNLGPPLDGTVRDKGMDFVVRKLMDPTMNNPATSMPRFPIDEEAARAIAEYLDTSYLDTQ